MHKTLLQSLFSEHKIAYTIVDHNLTVLDYGGNPTVFVNTNDIPVSLQVMDLIPELNGCEDILQDILNGMLPRFQLENINRTLPNEEIYYLNVVVLPYITITDGNSPQLLIVLTDTTTVTQVQQILTQQRNELSLLKHSLNDANQRLEYILQYYVPREVSKALMDEKITPKLGGGEREITTLFADLRDYTSISEKQTPNETIEMLHICLDIATSAIAEAGGVIVNYMGDAVMAIFNAPNEQPDHARRAVRAGLTLQAMTANYREQSRGAIPLHFGIGINTGVALVGNIGAQWYHQYTAVGDTINVASRICSYARANEVLIGVNTYNYVQNFVTANILPPLKFKGKSQEMTVYHVTALNDDTFIGTLKNN